MLAVPQAERASVRRPVAVLLQMLLEQRLGGPPAHGPGGGRRHGAGVDAVEIAAGGQDVEAAAVGAPEGPGSTKRPSSAGEQAAISPVRDGVERGGRGRPG
jgi:hypothetical protein